MTYLFYIDVRWNDSRDLSHRLWHLVMFGKSIFQAIEISDNQL